MEERCKRFVESRCKVGMESGCGGLWPCCLDLKAYIGRSRFQQREFSLSLQPIRVALATVQATPHIQT